MGTEHRKQYLAGAALTLAMAAFLWVVLSQLGRSDRQDLFLTDTADERFGWRYEVLAEGQATAYEPEFESDGQTIRLPEGIEAVRITRTMAEDIPGATLEWADGPYGMEVYLDGERLYSDFPTLEREADGFLRPSERDLAGLGWDPESFPERVHVSLPEGYPGRELAVTTYFPAGEDVPEPVYPMLDDPESETADAVTFSVRYEVLMTIYGILALAIAGMFLLDIRNDGGDWKILLLCVYFVMLFLDEASCGHAGYYSGLTSRIELRVLYGLNLTPLYLYLALRLKDVWRWPLAGGVAAWAAYACVSRYLRFRHDTVGLADVVGPGALLIFLAVVAAFCVEGLGHGGSAQRGWRRYILIAAAITVVYVLDRARVWGGIHVYLRDGIWGEIRMGNYGSLMSLIASVTSAMTVIVVVSEIVRRSLRTLRTVDVLRERERMTLEGYERMLKAQEATNAAYHELRHHMTALSGILSSGDAERAGSYVAAVSRELDQIPAGQYSQNLLVNVIAGSWLDRAMAEGVRVEHMLPVPRKLSIADADLSVLLNNMLQNALEACLRLGREADRYIRVEMSVVSQFLFVKCVNSAPLPDENSGGSAPGHGYGLTAMRRVAKKYGGELTVEQTPGTFSVQTSLCLTEAPETR